MLRITTHDKPESLTFQLEGTLAGPWVKELEDCWRIIIAGQRKVAVRVDLMAVTFVDAAGKGLLAAMHAQGAEFVCAGCWMRAVVADITRTPSCRSAYSEQGSGSEMKGGTPCPSHQQASESNRK